MKIVVIILCSFLALSVNAQKKDTAKIDTVKLFFSENAPATIDQFKKWLYDKPVTPKWHDEFIQLYNDYLNELYADWKKKKFGK